MPKIKEISLDLRQLIVDDHKNGLSYNKIAKKYKKSKATIQTVIRKFKNHQTIENMPRTGRPRKTSLRDDNRIIKEIKKEPTLSSKNIKEMCNLDVSVSTIQRRIRAAGFYGSHMKKKPFISEKNRHRRLQFAKKYVSKPLDFWKTIIWSDETKFELKNRKKRPKVWKRRGNQLDRKTIQTTIKHGGGNIMLWGCFSYGCVGNLVLIDEKLTGTKYVDILENNLPPSVEKMGLEGSFTFQQDNDPKHTSRVAQNYFVENNIQTLEWPAQSPDINPIENLWNYLDDKINRLKYGSKKMDFYKACLNAWNDIPNDLLQNLVKSIPKRLQDIIAAKGYHTKY